MRLGFFPALLIFLNACTSELPDFQSSAIADPTPDIVTDSPVIRPGDRVEVTYYERARANRNPYSLNRGDILSFNLVGEPDTRANSILVQSDGFASFPIVGQLQVVGMTMRQLSDELIKLFEVELYSGPLLNLALVSAFSVSEAELSSLSNSDAGDVFSVIVPENGRISLAQIGAFNALTTPAALENQIKARLTSRFGPRYGASVNIEERAPRTIFVTGAVTEPGEIAITGPLVPLQAVISAGGFSDTAQPRKVAVIRYDNEGRASSWIVDLRETLITGGRETPVLLKPRDIVYVPRSNVALTNANIQQYILNNLPFNVGVSYSLN